LQTPEQLSVLDFYLLVLLLAERYVQTLGVILALLWINEHRGTSFALFGFMTHNAGYLLEQDTVFSLDLRKAVLHQLLTLAVVKDVCLHLVDSASARPDLFKMLEVVVTVALLLSLADLLVQVGGGAKHPNCYIINCGEVIKAPSSTARRRTASC